MKPRAPRPQACNVFCPTPAPGRLWRFQPGKDRPALAASWPEKPGEPWPKAAVARDWRSLAQPRTNIGWLPADQVFVRVLELPANDLAEAETMIEFQLERLSPLPPAQVVWCAELLDIPAAPADAPPRLSVLVMLASRPVVEEQLGELAKLGFEADRLDVPIIRELTALRPSGDGLWVLLDESGDGAQALVAWRIGGQWREWAVMKLGEGAAAEAQLVQHLECAAWAGEMEGWLTALPAARVLGSPALVAAFEPVVSAWSGRPVETAARKPLAEVALLSAVRWVGAAAVRSLVPGDLARKRRDAFIDGLWFQALGTVGMVYLAGVFLYLIALKWEQGQVDDLRSSTSTIGRGYTNTLQLKAQVEVLQEQMDLRYAALDAWRAAVEHLPETLTLIELNFEKGRTLKLSGSVPAESKQDVTKFNADLGKVAVNGRPLFAAVKAAQITDRGGGPAAWNFEAELHRSDRP